MSADPSDAGRGPSPTQRRQRPRRLRASDAASAEGSVGGSPILGTLLPRRSSSPRAERPASPASTGRSSPRTRRALQVVPPAAAAGGLAGTALQSTFGASWADTTFSASTSSAKRRGMRPLVWMASGGAASHPDQRDTTASPTTISPPGAAEEDEPRTPPHLPIAPSPQEQAHLQLQASLRSSGSARPPVPPQPPPSPPRSPSVAARARVSSAGSSGAGPSTPVEDPPQQLQGASPSPTQFPPAASLPPAAAEGPRAERGDTTGGHRETSSLRTRAPSSPAPGVAKSPSLVTPVREFDPAAGSPTVRSGSTQSLQTAATVARESPPRKHARSPAAEPSLAAPDHHRGPSVWAAASPEAGAAAVTTAAAAAAVAAARGGQRQPNARPSTPEQLRQPSRWTTASSPEILSEASLTGTMSLAQQRDAGPKVPMDGPPSITSVPAGPGEAPLPAAPALKGCQPLQTIFSLQPRDDKDPSAARNWLPSPGSPRSGSPRGEDLPGPQTPRTGSPRAADHRALMTPPACSFARPPGTNGSFCIKHPQSPASPGSPRRRQRVGRSDFDVAASEAGESGDIRWKKGKTLGQGGFGSVFLGLVEGSAGGHEGRLIAVKNVMIGPVAGESSSTATQPEGQQGGEAAIEALQNEVGLMSRLRHKNIVQYIGMEHQIEEGVRYVNIFMEYVPGGSLQSLLEEFGQCTDEIASSYTRQILEGLIYLHENNVVHRDIKSGNILINTEGDLRLADFGAAVQLEKLRQKGGAGGLAGTALWMPPEIIREGGKREQHPSQDIWSLGCTVLEMLTAQPPFRWISPRDMEVLEDVADMERPVALPPPKVTLSAAADCFLRGCLRKTPEDREPAAKLLEYDYIKLADSNPVTVKDKQEQQREQDSQGRMQSPQRRSFRRAPGSPRKSRAGSGLSAPSFTPKTVSLGPVPASRSSRHSQADTEGNSELSASNSMRGVRRARAKSAFGPEGINFARSPAHHCLHTSSSASRLPIGLPPAATPNAAAVEAKQSLLSAEGIPFVRSQSRPSQSTRLADPECEVKLVREPDESFGFVLTRAPNPHPMQLDRVTEDSPAKRAGCAAWLQHRLVAINGTEVRCPSDVAALCQGQREVTLRFLRFRLEQTVEVLRSSGQWSRAKVWRIDMFTVIVEGQRRGSVEATLGVELNGVKIVKVTTSGPAALAGVREPGRDGQGGWRVRELYGRKLSTREELDEAWAQGSGAVRARLVVPSANPNSGRYVVFGAEKPQRVSFKDARPQIVVQMTPHGLGKGEVHVGTVQRKTADAAVVSWASTVQGGAPRVEKETEEPAEWWDGGGAPLTATTFEKDILFENVTTYLRRPRGSTLPRGSSTTPVILSALAAAVAAFAGRPTGRSSLGAVRSAAGSIVSVTSIPESDGPSAAVPAFQQRRQRQNATPPRSPAGSLHADSLLRSPEAPPPVQAPSRGLTMIDLDGMGSHSSPPGSPHSGDSPPESDRSRPSRSPRTLQQRATLIGSDFSGLKLPIDFTSQGGFSVGESPLPLQRGISGDSPVGTPAVLGTPATYNGAAEHAHNGDDDPDDPFNEPRVPTNAQDIAVTFARKCARDRNVDPEDSDCWTQPRFTGAYSLQHPPSFQETETAITSTSSTTRDHVHRGSTVSHQGRPTTPPQPCSTGALSFSAPSEPPRSSFATSRGATGAAPGLAPVPGTEGQGTRQRRLTWGGAAQPLAERAQLSPGLPRAASQRSPTQSPTSPMGSSATGSPTDRVRQLSHPVSSASRSTLGLPLGGTIPVGQQLRDGAKQTSVMLAAASSDGLDGIADHCDSQTTDTTEAAETSDGEGDAPDGSSPMNAVNAAANAIAIAAAASLERGESEMDSSLVTVPMRQTTEESVHTGSSGIAPARGEAGASPSPPRSPGEAPKPLASSLRRGRMTPGGPPPPQKSVSFDASVMEGTLRSSARELHLASTREPPEPAPLPLQVLAGTAATRIRMLSDQQKYDAVVSAEQKAALAEHLDAAARRALAHTLRSGRGHETLLRKVLQPLGWEGDDEPGAHFEPAVEGKGLQRLLQDVCRYWKVTHFAVLAFGVPRGAHHGLTLSAAVLAQDDAPDGGPLVVASVCGPGARAGVSPGATLLCVDGIGAGEAAADRLQAPQEVGDAEGGADTRMVVAVINPSPTPLSSPGSPTADCASPASLLTAATPGELGGGATSAAASPAPPPRCLSEPRKWLVHQVKRKARATNIIIVVLAVIFIVLLSVLVHLYLLFLLVLVVIFLFV
eukprot:TRINITY_DN8388_c0_g1_i2.p1 TRINITY_DN8388_c0_g1~~TRINITY_DN8388_c0_g1_i2.p1  ORF type:complete len:2278 (+),score=355.87 TRINITY_DN8388_c0_g1_i2:97-6834(+)